MLVDLGSLEDWPSNTIPGFTDGLLKLLPGVAEHSCSLGRARRVRERLERRHVARPRRRARRAGAPARDPARTSRGARRAAPAQPGRYNVIYGYWEEQVGRRGRRPCRPPRQPPRRARGRLRLRAELERADPARRAPAVRTHRTQAIVDEAASRDIPWHPAERAVARAARPGEVPAADPRHDDLEDQRARGRHRGRQEDDEHAARRRRACRCPAARSCAPTTRPPPRRGGSGSPSSRSRWTATTDAGSGSTSAPSAPSAPAFKRAVEESRNGRRGRRDAS